MQVEDAFWYFCDQETKLLSPQQSVKAYTSLGHVIQQTEIPFQQNINLEQFVDFHNQLLKSFSRQQYIESVTYVFNQLSKDGFIQSQDVQKQFPELDCKSILKFEKYNLQDFTQLLQPTIIGLK